MTISSSKAKAFIARLTNEEKDELLEKMIMNKSEDVEVFYGDDLRSFIPRLIVSGLIVGEDDEWMYLYDLTTIMVDSLCGELDHSIVEETVNMIIGLDSLQKYHSDVAKLFKEYNVINGFRVDGKPIAWKDFPNEEPIAMQSALSHPLSECIHRYLDWYISGDYESRL